MSILFEQTQIKTMVLRNRFVRSATVDNGAESGYVSEHQIKLFRGLADGGVGLIITGMTCVLASDQIRPSQDSFAGDDRIPAYKRLTAAVHNGGAKIAVQLAHAGRERGKFLAGDKDQALAPSVVADDPYCETTKYRAMTQEEIWKVIEAFGDAAQRAREAGFDAVQLHGAHAFLLAQFLSPYTNLRADEWGGSLENRLRIHSEIYRAIRRKVGEDYPVLLKLGVQDGFPGGLDFSEGKRAAQLLALLGFDALEISQGLRGERFEGTEFRTNIDGPDREAYFQQWAQQIKQCVNVPVMIVGGLRTFTFMEEFVRKGGADYVSLCRPFIREPGIVDKWSSGDLGRPKCISCNRCIEVLKKGDFLHCVQEEAKKKLLREGRL